MCLYIYIYTHKEREREREKKREREREGKIHAFILWQRCNDMTLLAASTEEASRCSGQRCVRTSRVHSFSAYPVRVFVARHLMEAASIDR